MKSKFVALFLLFVILISAIIVFNNKNGSIEQTLFNDLQIKNLSAPEDAGKLFSYFNQNYFSTEDISGPYPYSSQVNPSDCRACTPALDSKNSAPPFIYLKSEHREDSFSLKYCECEGSICVNPTLRRLRCIFTAENAAYLFYHPSICRDRNVYIIRINKDEVGFEDIIEPEYINKGKVTEKEFTYNTSEWKTNIQIKDSKIEMISERQIGC